MLPDGLLTCAAKDLCSVIDFFLFAFDKLLAIAAPGFLCA
jgi:hypothetical protein